MAKVHLTDQHPIYHIWLNDKVIGILISRGGHLTWSQMDDIAAGYQEWYELKEKQDV